MLDVHKAAFLCAFPHAQNYNKENFPGLFPPVLATDVELICGNAGCIYKFSEC